MKDNFDADPPPSRKPDQERKNEHSAPDAAHASAAGSSNGAHSTNPLGFWVVVDLLVQRWHWLVIGGFCFAAAFYVLGWYFITPKFTAEAQLFRNEPPGWSDFFKTPPLSGDTLSALIRSPRLVEQVSTNIEPPIAAEKLVRSIKIEPETDSDIVKVFIAAGDAQRAVDLANLYTREAVEFTRDLQRQQAGLMANDYLKEQVAHMDKDIAALRDIFRGSFDTSQVTNKLGEIDGHLNTLSRNLTSAHSPSPLIQREKQRLDKALVDLDDLLAKYTERNPLVEGKQQQIAEIKKRLADYSTNSISAGQEVRASESPVSAAQLGGATTFNPEAEIIKIDLTTEQQARIQLANRQREAEQYAAKATGMVRIHASANLSTVKSNKRSLKIGAMSLFGGLLGMAGSLLLIMLVELADNRLKTPEDLKRVTKLPVLTTLGNLDGMAAADRSQWAFRAWTMLQGRLSPSANHGLVCGITSSTPGEGRSTWISLLAEAASMSGFRVLTIATRPSPTNGASKDEDLETPLLQSSETNQPTNGSPELSKQGNDMQTNGSSNHSTALTSNVLNTPAKVTEQLNSQPMVHIPLPGWVWNLERRKQWREALLHWRNIDNLVILVELPPAGVAEAVLLGSNLPNLVWLADSGTASAAETRAQLETLRHARCNLVGAVLNRELAPSLKKRFPRWLDCIVLLLALTAGGANAQEKTTNASEPAIASPAAGGTQVPGTNNLQAPGSPLPATARSAQPAETRTNVSFSIVKPAQRALWQQRLTLGPGDVLTFGLYGQPDLGRAEVAIGPDGRVSYLEAQDVLATGLTIDELRSKLDQELANYRRAPRTLITPIAFKSKKYYMLGKVMTKGVYTLDGPLTVLEAIARAHGLENGLVDRNVIDLADFQRTFLVRGGKRIPLNFEKLFQDGDLSQNLAIEPDDYLYFPSTNVKEVYVVGEVRLPGPVIYNPALTIMAAISGRAGYTERAYKARVLVVRGSLNNPETFAVDTHAILDGKAPDFKLLPKDIIYVNSRPFILGEELADLALTAFIQGAITAWVGADVVKPFNQ